MLPRMSKRCLVTEVKVLISKKCSFCAGEFYFYPNSAWEFENEGIY